MNLLWLTHVRSKGSSEGPHTSLTHIASWRVQSTDQFELQPEEHRCIEDISVNALSDILHKFAELTKSPPSPANTSASALKIPVPRTPNKSRLRAQSTSSTESFPVPGMRASAGKEERRKTRTGKHTPTYKPPQGTKEAAQLIYSAVSG